MRYTITLGSHTVATTDHLDVAEVLREHSEYPVSVLDTWTNKLVQRPRKSVDELPWGTIDSFILRSQKIQAIKLVRELTGLGLGEAKQVVDKRAVLVEKIEQGQNPGF